MGGRETACAIDLHSNKFLSPACGAVLPVLHLNGYKRQSAGAAAQTDRNEFAVTRLLL
jgi:phosphoketolase